METSGKEAVLSLTIVLCLFSEVYFHILNHIDVGYTHMFYIPILLAAIWYGYSSLAVVSLLGGLHIVVGLSQGELFAPAFRVLLMAILASLVSYLVSWQEIVDEDIERLKRQSRETVAQLRMLTEHLKAP